MDNNSKIDENDLSWISIDVIYESKKLDEEKTTSIKTRDNKACDDINKDNKDTKEEVIEEKKYIPVVNEKKDKVDASTQTDKSNLDDDESSDENTYNVHSYINKKKKREDNDDE